MSLHAAAVLEEVLVIGVSPGGLSRQQLSKVPYAVQASGARQLQDSAALDLTDFMNQQLGSVSINSAQNNPLQPDVQFRGFTASPLLGLPQGLSVYQNGVRINEPLGDAVNWDLLPASAVNEIQLIGGSNPVFGLNTLGGALAISMKNGFNFVGKQAELLGGSWGRVTSALEAGGNNGQWGYYLNADYFAEDGWRDLSASDALNLYSTVSWRDDARSGLDLSVQQGDSKLIGNGALPVGLLEIDRTSVFTAPDITENSLQMIALEGWHQLRSGLKVSGTMNWRENRTSSFNGDASDYELCRFANGSQALFEESADLEVALEEQLGLQLDEICEGEVAAVGSFDELLAQIQSRAQQAGLAAEDFLPEDVSQSLSGTGILSDEAINNISHRLQTSRSFSLQMELTDALFGKPNLLVSGIAYADGKSHFDAVLELSGLDPLSRSTYGLGTGTLVPAAATNVNTRTTTWSWYFTDTIDLSDEFSLTLSGRYNNTEISLRDRSGVRPELDGDHRFSRLNPALGLTYNPNQDRTWYVSYSQSNRVPTPIELACNEGVYTLAQHYAQLAGEDPESIDFECRLPNAFLADPPLDDVVTTTVEAGVRGSIAELDYDLNVFSATNRDDILFQTTGRSTGLFANVDATRRRGIELNLSGSLAQLDWYANGSWLQATFESDFMVLSPNHPAADDNGQVPVHKGKRIPGLPEVVLKLGGDLHLNEALTVSAELLYNADQVLRGDESNGLDTVPGYTLLNLRGTYQWSEQLVVFARVTNVLDESYLNFGLLGEDPTEVLPDLRDQRPWFMGVGAPRAAWVGARYRF